MTGEQSKEGFVGRWSRLKQQGGDESELAVQESLSEVDQLNADAADVAEEVKLLTDEDMPDIETMDEHSDYTGFLSEGVSDALKRKAMHKLFHLPEFNIRDGLNDYDDDFSTFIPLGDTVTYQMKQWLEQEAKEAKAKLLEKGDKQHEGSAGQSSSSPQDVAEDDNKQVQSESYSALEEDVEDDLEGELDEDMEGQVS